MKQFEMSEIEPNPSYQQSAEKSVAATSGRSFDTRVSVTPAPAIHADPDTTDPSTRIASMTADDINFIRTHGTRAYAEELQKKIVDEIRQKLLSHVGLTQESLDQASLLDQQIIEGLIAVEIDARLNANLSLADKSTADENTYLKAMMLSQGNYGVFESQVAITLDDFRKLSATPSVNQ